jgi:hypothetical protein
MKIMLNQQLPRYTSGPLLFLFSAFLLFGSPSFSQTPIFAVGDKWTSEFANLRSDGSDYGAFFFQEGLSAVRVDSTLGFIDSSFHLVIPFHFSIKTGDRASHYKFVDHKAIVCQSNKWGVIDTLGRTIVPFLYDGIKAVAGYYYVHQNYKNGYLDSVGNVVIPLEHEWPATPYRTKEIIEDEIVKDLKRRTLESTAEISKAEAIEIARKEGYYHADAWPSTPQVVYDAEKELWTIQSTEKKGTTYEGKCAHTNGCLVLIIYHITISASSGKVKKKSQEKTLIAIYE